MIVIYKTLTETEIRNDAKSAIRKINKWFKANPDRKDCKAETWYGEMSVIRRGHVSKDVNAAAEAAINKK